jgi:glycine oxidase
MKAPSITVVGAGIVGLWQAYTLASRGHNVRLVERTPRLFDRAASAYAGAMLAPFCEREAAPPVVQDLGLRALDIWRATFPGVVNNGTLVLAHPNDSNELVRFSRLTEGHRSINSNEIAELEPDLAGRFDKGLFYAEEAHVEPAAAAAFLLQKIRGLNAAITFDKTWSDADADYVIDCRGMGANQEIISLRGVRGERLLIQTQDITLKRPVRLLHRRVPVYIVPWDKGTYMVGATVIESEDEGPVTLRSSLDLQAIAYALHPSFGGAGVISLDAGVRPAFPDNVPRIVIHDRHISVNGLYRHGFLLAPALAELVADYLAGEVELSPLLVEN